MGLKLTLKKEDNFLFHDFVDAYWVVKDVRHNLTSTGFDFSCYPSREASKLEQTEMPTPSIPVGDSVDHSVYTPLIYRWFCEVPISYIFPNGIPVSSDEQKTIVYNWIKNYTGLPFEDVFEEDQA